MVGEHLSSKGRLNLRLVEQPRLPTPSRNLLKRGEAQIFDLDPIWSDPPHCVFGGDVLPLHFLRGG